MAPATDSELTVLPNNTNKTWVKDKGLRKLNLGIGLIFCSAATSGYNASLINGLLVLPEFRALMAGLSPKLLGLVIASASLGAIMSYTPASYIVDILGRKTGIAIGSILTICGAVIQVAVPKQWAFFGTRVLVGVAMGVSQTAAPLLATEIAHPRQRQTATALYNSTWCAGSITSAAVTFATLSVSGSWSWRIASLLQIFYPIAQLIGLLFLPESPRWLVSKNRKDEALDILARYHANGKADDELVQHEFQQICSSIGADADFKPRPWSSFFSSRGDIHRLAICILVGFMQEWAGNGIITYYLSPILTSIGISNSRDQAAVNVSLQAWNLCLSAAGAVASERYGRRILWLLATGVMLFFLSIITIFASLFTERHITPAGIAVVPMFFLFFSAFDIAYAPLFIAYPAEILPFQLRAKGLAITLTMDSVACFFNQYVNPVAFTALQWRYYIVYVGCLVVFFILVYFLFPETKGRSLEEVSMIFERKQVLEEKRVAVDSEKKGGIFAV
ncbi:hypothetical protein NUU61_004796 [Penicillium alfredii]|uniref:Major facilitator superfamily (MFS) profile domain-containing protein n=1 Tax=Penicillium alfredii TaxID=1506179 RepID=A0A9W9F8F7_9EURO|nr:uncharacterized protein NUU61_004796 [Penicillium alfredii]KAJ5095440.1 hypothetical protein NUU61_004796 [Penicillium alfredii]